MVKKTIKINFKYFHEGFDPKNNLFTNILREDYNVEISKNPDYLFYSVYPEIKKDPNLSKKGDFIRKISPNLYIFLRKIYSFFIKKILGKRKLDLPEGNFIKIFYGAEKVRPNMKECDYAFSVYFEEEINNKNYTRIPTHVLTDFLIPSKLKFSLKRNIDFKKIKKEKTRFCNFIYAQDVAARNRFFSKLNKFRKVDSPGRCMNNMPPIGEYQNPKSSRLSFNWPLEKLKFLKKYKFTIAFENEFKEGYTTEKLTHPLMVNSIPIYFGNKKVGRDFNEKCFINSTQFSNEEELIKHIIEVDKNDELYKEYLKQPIFKNKEQYYFNSEERIRKKLKEIIESKK